MSKKEITNATEGIKESSGNLGSLPDQKISNSEPRTDTTSLPNPLQRKVSVGRHGTITGVPPESIESLRPSAGAIKNG